MHAALGTGHRLPRARRLCGGPAVHARAPSPVLVLVERTESAADRKGAPMTVLVRCTDDNELVCRYGMLGEIFSAVHHPRSPGFRGRACVHLLTNPPAVIACNIEAINRLGPLPYLYTGYRWPAIVSRRDNVVTMAFDRHALINGCARLPAECPTYRLRYRIEPLRWWDAEEADDRNALGVLL